MNVHRILIDDNSPVHRALSIYRTGAINRVQLQDISYKAYSSLEIDAHDYAAFFHYGLPEPVWFNRVFLRYPEGAVSSPRILNDEPDYPIYFKSSSSAAISFFPPHLRTIPA